MSAEPPVGYFQCPGCAKRYALRAALAGKTVQCKCGRKMIAPMMPKEVVRPRAASAAPEPVREPSLADILDEDAPAGDASHDDLDEAVGPVRSARTAGDDDDGDWKWWYFVVVGILIAAFSVWQILSGEPILRLGGRRGGPVGGLILAVICIVVGLFSRPAAGRDR